MYHYSMRGNSTRLWAALFALGYLVGNAHHAHSQARDEHLPAGIAAYKAGDMRKAIDELKLAMKAQPSASAALYLGNAYLQRKKLAEAKHYFRLAIKLDPKRAPAINAVLKELQDRDATTVTITSEPPGANVFVDNAKTAIGQTPLDVDLETGKHAFRVELAGYETATAQETLAFGKDKSLQLTLQAKPCQVTYAIEPSDTSIGFDGAPPPATRLLTLSPGEHTATLAATGFDSQTLPVQCLPGGIVEVKAALVATKGIVKVPITDGNTKLLVDGAEVTLTPDQVQTGLQLPPGKHEITVVRVGLPPVVKQIEVPSGGEVAVEVPPPPPPPVPKAPAPPPPPPPVPYEAGRLYIGVQGSGNVVLRNWDLGQNAFIAQSGMSGVHPSSSALAGARIGYQFMRRAAIEADVNWIGLPNELDMSSGMAYTVSGVYHLLNGKWAPIVEAGFGAYQVVSGQLGSNTDFRAHIGAGLRGKIHERFVVRANVRDVLTDGFDSAGGNNIEIMVGIEMAVANLLGLK